MENIQDLLDLYKDRKNAQGGVIQYSTLKALSAGEDGMSLQIEGTYKGCGFTSEQRDTLAGKMFLPLGVVADGDAVFVRGSVRQVTDQLVHCIDIVAIEPQTEYLQTILKQEGVFCSQDNAPDNAPAVLPYPYRGKSMRQFEQLGGVFMYQSDVCDTTVADKGVVVSLPSSYSNDFDARDTNIAVLTLHRMGLRLPFNEAVISNVERALEESKRASLLRYAIGGRVGRSSLIAYNDLYAPTAVQIAVLDDPAMVAERLKSYATQVMKAGPGNMAARLTPAT